MSSLEPPSGGVWFTNSGRPSPVAVFRCTDQRLPPKVRALFSSPETSTDTTVALAEGESAAAVAAAAAAAAAVELEAKCATSPVATVVASYHARDADIAGQKAADGEQVEDPERGVAQELFNTELVPAVATTKQQVRRWGAEYYEAVQVCVFLFVCLSVWGGGVGDLCVFCFVLAASS